MSTDIEIMYPVGLPQTFAALVEKNTIINIETLGYLYGESGRITTVYIPEQIGTEVNCTETGFTQSIDNLELLGWIHTHPAFDVYPSQTDIQSQISVQANSPSAVGFIISNLKKEYATFRVNEKQEAYAVKLKPIQNLKLTVIDGRVQSQKNLIPKYNSKLYI